MIEIYYTKNVFLHEKTKILIARRLQKDFTIERSANGKPYITGNPLFFSLTHSRGKAMIALCDKPVGIDLEFSDGRKNFSHILSRFTRRERLEIGADAVEFYKNWTAKEAFVKMIGGTLANDLGKLEFTGGRLLFNGVETGGTVSEISRFGKGIYSVCAQGYTNEQLSKVKERVFVLHKGEYL